MQASIDDAAQAFSGRLRRQNPAMLDAFAQAEILSGLPYIFRRQDELGAFQEHVASLLGVADASAGVLVVGSARTGFSLDPDNYPQPFRASSDIDLVIVDTELFDAAWQTLLVWDYLSKGGRTSFEDHWLSDRRSQTFSGWYDPTQWRRDFDLAPAYPQRLKPLRDQAFRWFSAFQSLSRYRLTPEVAKHRVTARLYRTREHASKYHVHGLRALQSKLLIGSLNAV
jgi:hypothetical protein